MNASKSDAPGPSTRSKGKSAVIERPEGRLFFLDLPLETQQQIIAQISRKDLFSLQRVSLHFLSLASTEIYRDLDLKITNSADDENGAPSSHAADALQTICASEYDYGQHIKSFRLGVNEDSIEYTPTTRGLGHVGQDPLLMTRLLWDSRSDSSKFLNTALLLVARKLRILETFQWDAPIEISGAVYQALHKIQSLRCLRIRLDISPSPKLMIRSGPSPPNPSLAMQQAMQAQMQNQAPLPALPPQFVPPPPGPGNASINYPAHAAAKINNIKRKKAGGSGGLTYWANGRAFSGFKSLHTLILVGMSNHDCLYEIAECIKASSASLKCLTLSLSTELARKSRKPVPVNNPEVDDPSDTEMDDEDELSQPPQPPMGASQATTTTNEADIRKEKVAQESILAKVFDLQSVSAEGKRLEKTLSLSGGQLREEEDSQDNIRMVNQQMKSLMDSSLAAGSDATSLEIRLHHFKMIKDAAEKYISHQETQKKKLLTEQIKPPTPSVNKASSKPLNPLASGFKPSSTNKGPSVINIDFGTVSNPTSPYFPSGSGDSLSNGTPKPFVPSGGFPSLDPSSPLSYLPGTSSSKSASSQPSTSSYVAGSYPAASNSPLAFPYEHSNHSTTGLHSPLGYPSPLQAPSSATWGMIPSSKDAFQHKYVSSVGQTQKIKHKPPKKPTPAKKGYPFSSEDESEGTKTPPSAPQPFFAASVDTETLEGSMDIDMEHPDEDTTDLGEDQEIIAGSEGLDETATPRKRAKVGLVETGSSSNTANQEANPSIEDSSTTAMSSDEAMQAYIRATHGLQLEEFSLEWVPLKASIVARALDLSVLERLTLLEVGPQDAFWTLLVRLQSATQITAFKSIHTDNVSLPFVKFLTTFEGLEELFMLERNKKQAVDPEPESTVTISTIRKGALRKHMPTLRRLSLRNERNEQWDVDPKTLRMLALKGTKLRELAFSLSLKTYHVLMQLLPHLKNLYALHIITLRSTDRSVQLRVESISFAVDNLSHCPNMKLRYMAMIDQVIALESKPIQFRRHLKTVIDKRKDKKGKGKALADASLSLFIPATDDSGSDEVDDILADMGAGETKLKFSTRFAEVRDVKIFSKEVKGGKL